MPTEEHLRRPTIFSPSGLAANSANLDTDGEDEMNEIVSKAKAGEIIPFTMQDFAMGYPQLFAEYRESFARKQALAFGALGSGIGAGVGAYMHYYQYKDVYKSTIGGAVAGFAGLALARYTACKMLSDEKFVEYHDDEVVMLVKQADGSLKLE